VPAFGGFDCGKPSILWCIGFAGFEHMFHQSIQQCQWLPKGA
jgi:hypothetical protein